MTATETPDLKPCPFCGDTGPFPERGDLDCTYIQCNACLAHGPSEISAWTDDEDDESISAASAKWNRRSGRDGNAENAPSEKEIEDALGLRDWLAGEHKESPPAFDRVGEMSFAEKAYWFVTARMNAIHQRMTHGRGLKTDSQKIDYGTCPTCHGKKQNPMTCPDCGGTGEAQDIAQEGDAKCPTCKGEGGLRDELSGQPLICGDCGGTGEAGR